MKRSLSQLLAGERIPHPDNPDAAEAYDLLILADGPWTEARYKASPPLVIATRKWVEYVRLLLPSATFDVDTAKQNLDDAEEDARVAGMRHGPTAQAAEKRIRRKRLNRAHIALRKATEQRTDIREALHLDDEDTDGES